MWEQGFYPRVKLLGSINYSRNQHLSYFVFIAVRIQFCHCVPVDSLGPQSSRIFFLLRLPRKSALSHWSIISNFGCLDSVFALYLYFDRGLQCFYCKFSKKCNAPIHWGILKQSCVWWQPRISSFSFWMRVQVVCLWLMFLKLLHDISLVPGRQGPTKIHDRYTWDIQSFPGGMSMQRSPVGRNTSDPTKCPENHSFGTKWLNWVTFGESGHPGFSFHVSGLVPVSTILGPPLSLLLNHFRICSCVSQPCVTRLHDELQPDCSLLSDFQVDETVFQQKKFCLRN